MDRDVECIGCSAPTSGVGSCDTCCPRGHTGAQPLPEEVTGDIEAAVRCAKCPADYVRVRNRWFEAPRALRQSKS